MVLNFLPCWQGISVSLILDCPRPADLTVSIWKRLKNSKSEMPEMPDARKLSFSYSGSKGHRVGLASHVGWGLVGPWPGKPDAVRSLSVLRRCRVLHHGKVEFSYSLTCTYISTWKCLFHILSVLGSLFGQFAPRLSCFRSMAQLPQRRSQAPSCTCPQRWSEEKAMAWRWTSTAWAASCREAQRDLLPCVLPRGLWKWCEKVGKVLSLTGKHDTFIYNFRS